MKTIWIPESVDNPGFYSISLLSPKHDKDKSTLSVRHARQFSTQDECEKWCEENPSPAFTPHEHIFEDADLVDLMVSRI